MRCSTPYLYLLLGAAILVAGCEADAPPATSAQPHITEVDVLEFGGRVPTNLAHLFGGQIADRPIDLFESICVHNPTAEATRLVLEADVPGFTYTSHETFELAAFETLCLPAMSPPVDHEALGELTTDVTAIAEVRLYEDGLLVDVWAHETRMRPVDVSTGSRTGPMAQKTPDAFWRPTSSPPAWASRCSLPRRRRTRRAAR